MAKESHNQRADLGVLGLAVMGANLARNFASRGLAVSVFNRTASVTEDFLHNHGSEGTFFSALDLRAFAQTLERPRKVILMVKAGAAVDAVIGELLEVLEPGDFIIDAGNSFFRDTNDREQRVRAQGVNFFGVGVSGGEEGALKGPSIMPGGDKGLYLRELHPLFEKIAAIGDGPCVSYVGPAGAGHFVKMVHNGIEYADMQLLAEAFDVLRRGLGQGLPEVGALFSQWNEGVLASYLVEISANIATTKDPETGYYLLDYIVDQAAQKGTGVWTVQEALSLGVPVPSIDAAVRARMLSSRRELRLALSEQTAPYLRRAGGTMKGLDVSVIEDALYLGKILAYAEGIDLMQSASDAFKWDLDIAEIARLWMAGCIIRSQLLSVIREAYRGDELPPHFLVSGPCLAAVQTRLSSLRTFVAQASLAGIPVPAFSAALANFDSLTTQRLPQYFTQAQRDYFGAHTFKRIDKPGSFHHEW